jgi:pyrroline-5-carboxylate reductase
MEAPRIAFVGSGGMAEAMIDGLLSGGGSRPERIWAAGPRAARAAELHARYGVHATTDNREAIRNADLVVLAVKPQSLAAVLPAIRPALLPGQVVISIAAGARMGVLGRALGHPAIVRCMPNTPCQIRRGVAVWTATPEVDEPARRSVRAILRSLGEEIYVSDEADIDRSAAVHGIGPALVAHFVKSFEAAAGAVGETPGLARRSVLATILGTVEMILGADRQVSEVIDEVVSPGGVTSRAMDVLDRGGFSAVLAEAMEAAYRRTLELRDTLDAQLGDDAAGDD